MEQLLAQWLPDAAGRYLVLCEDDAAAAQTAEQAEKLFGAGTHIYKDAEGFAADEAATLRLLVCANGPAVQAPLAGISGVVLVRRSAGPAAYRQMLARALAADPEILLLDDSSSALDFATDAALRRAIHGLSGSMTTFIVSQRIACIRQADKILVLDNGRLAGRGTHDELMQFCKVYREIATSQLSAAELA